MDRRTKHLPATVLRSGDHGLEIYLRVADSFLPRLRGLAGRGVKPSNRAGLWFPKTRSVHTFGMNFNLDLVWLDASGTVVRIDEAVPPRRLASCTAASSVIELAAGSARRLGIKDGLRLTA